jgi:thiol:disulfide interchange protein
VPRMGNRFLVWAIRTHMRNARTNLFTILIILLSLFTSASAQLFGDPHTKAELILGQTEVIPGSELQVAFRLTMEEHWHTYWKYAGEVGLPTEAEWKLPEGWEASDIRWPVPDYLDTAGGVSFAYEGTVMLPVTIKVPANAKVGETVELSVHLNWLECEETCVPGEADLSRSVTISEKAVAGPDAEQIDQAIQQIPPTVDAIQASRLGEDLFVTLPDNLAVPGVKFFPDSAGQIVLKEAQLLDGKTLVLKVPATTDEPLEKLSGLLAADGEGVQFQASIEKKAKPPVEAAAIGTILLTAGAAFLGGLVLNLMPCVFPVLSLKVLGIVEQSRSEGRPAWHHGVVFALGVLISFWVMSGLLLVVRSAGQEVGWGYHLQNPIMIGFLAILFLLIGLNLFGVFEVGENLTQLSGVAEKKEGLAHSFWSGVLTTLAATPCTAPFMGGAVGFALSQPPWVALLVFSFLALGVAAPYMTLTLFPALLEKLPAPGAWMVTFKQILAFPMLLAVVWLVWVFGSQAGNNRLALLLVSLLGVSFASWVYGKWGSSFEPKEKRLGSFFAVLVLITSLYTAYTASQTPAGVDLWQKFSPELVAQLKSEGKPFFLDFTADWCTSCKANELVALSNQGVIEKFQDKNVVLVKADWTNEDPVITQALAEFNRAGVPLYVLYPGNGAEPVVLPEVLFPGTVLEALDRVP